MISKLALTVSFLIHLLIFMGIRFKDAQTKPQQEEKQVRIKRSNPTFPDEMGDYSKCKSVYVGIGVITNFITDEVLEVSPHGPALRAGVRKGDVILSICGDDKEIGKVCNLVVLRGTERIEFNIKSEKLCYE